MLKLAELVKGYGINGRIVIDLSLARGLDYYTGFVWEFKLEQEGEHLPSIGGWRQIRQSNRNIKRQRNSNTCNWFFNRHKQAF